VCVCVGKEKIDSMVWKESGSARSADMVVASRVKLYIGA
jgi:hypothetical protein